MAPLTKLTLVQAIARQEGFGKPGTRATRNQNPGNLNFGFFAKQHGATTGDDKGYAVFPDDATGFAALTALLRGDSYRNLTLTACLHKYCPPTGDVRGDNDTATYLRNVSDWTGIAPEQGIGAFL